MNILCRNAKTFLKELITTHYQETGSVRAEKILANFEEVYSKIWLIFPASEKSNALVEKVSYLNIYCTSSFNLLFCNARLLRYHQLQTPQFWRS